MTMLPGRRSKPLYLVSGAGAPAGWAAAIFLPLPLWLMVPLLVVIGFAWAKESLLLVPFARETRCRQSTGL